MASTDALPARESDGGLSFDVLVSPRASRAQLGPVRGDRVKIAVTAPPVDGEANAAVIELVAKALGVARAAVTIAAGAASKRKTVRVRGATIAALARALGATAAIAIAIAAGACDGKTGTYAVSLVTAPGSHVLDPVTHARLALSDPHAIVEADRGADGSFALDIDVTAAGTNATLAFEGTDAGGAIVAWGQTPPLPVAAIDATIAIYVAPPMSLAAAPVALDPPRADLAIARLSYGGLFAGGADAAGAPRADLVIYDAYAHVLQTGLDLPAARSAMTAAPGATGLVYLFGGDDAAGPTSTFWRFDTTVAPAGQYLDLTSASSPSYARAGASAAPIGTEQFVVAGAPPLLLDGIGLRTAALTTPAALGGVGTSALSATAENAVFVGDGAGTTGVAILSSAGYQEIAAPADALRTGHGVVTTDAGAIVAIGGGPATGLVDDAIRIDVTAAPPTATAIAGALVTPRKDAAIATIGTLLVVAGGTDAAGNVLADAEVIDLPGLTPRATIPLAVARTGAQALALPDGQILIAGGRDATGAPVGTIELFTPPAPSSL